MNITADTNVLVRACVQDDAQQAQLAADVLRKAHRIAVSSTTLCEFVWVLQRAYQFTDADIVKAIRLLIRSKNVVCEMPAIELGLAAFEQGGDFADGIIAFSGASLGGAELVSFDKKAVAVLKAQRKKARLLG
ncbi:MAG: DNA-binding protein [Proteobacteria bacterium SG_bin4]|nr:MAG: DNA-binding protein [Proteobacteria bacterium SG_bin4]